MSNMPVGSIKGFQKKYGQTGIAFRLLVEEFIRTAPEFPGDKELAKKIGEAMADLEVALHNDFDR